MTRKFLFCFPLRLGNIIFGYIVIIIAIAVVAYNLLQLGLTLVSDSYETDERFRNFEKLETLFDKEKKTLVEIVVIFYYASYLVIGFLLFIFSALFTCGAYKANCCLVSTFFGYSFFHLFFSIGLIVWEILCSGWIQLGLVIAFDLLLMICLFSVKYLMEAIRTGHMYSRPGEVYHKY